MNTKKATLLIIDDLPTNLKVLFSYLSSLNFKVRVARSGKDALAQIAHTPPDLILLDVVMPDLNGFEVCRRLKADEKTRDIPVIFMTGKTETVEKLKGFELGAVDYITKPVQQEEVLARINAHLTIRALQKELEQKNVELEQQNAELKAFAHTVAHDIKNPINVIMSSTHFLIQELSSVVDSDSLKKLQHIAQSGGHVASIIDALLLLAGVRHQKVCMEFVDMGRLISQAQQRLAKMIEDYQGKIVTPSEWPAAQGYAPWILEVWTNYLSNGLKYGGRPPRLELGATPENDYIRFWVRDNGRGLTEKEQSQLFVPFSRITQAHIEGSGLGLSIVLRIVEKCGGKVGVESQVGQGSTFYFTLPAC